MTTDEIRILAIDPGAREIGVAILDKGALLYYGVKTIRKRRGDGGVPRQVRDITYRLIERYCPHYLVIAEAQGWPQSGRALVLSTINIIADAAGLRVVKYSSAYARSVVCDAKPATKRRTATLLAQRYHELTQYIDTQDQWRTMYYAKLFNALAVAIACYEDILRNTGKVEIYE